MAVLDFNAYTLEYLQEGEGYYDENGDRHEVDGTWIPYGKCNAVPAGVNNVISLPDGQTQTFSFTIHLHDPHAREFRYGERLRLTFDGIQYDLTVKGFARYQHQCKVFA